MPDMDQLLGDVASRYKLNQFFTVEDAGCIFSYVAQIYRLVWEIQSNGCFGRVHEICGILNAISLPCWKIFIMSGKRLKRGTADMMSPKKPLLGPSLPWPMHVALCLYVNIGSGEPDLLVIDPAVMNSPSSVNEWIAAMGDPNALPAVSMWTNYIPGTYAISSDGNLALSDFERDDDFRKTDSILESLETGRRKLSNGS